MVHHTPWVIIVCEKPYKPKNHWTLQWRGVEPVGVRVLKIASFAGPGFLGNTLFCRINPRSISEKKHIHHTWSQIWHLHSLSQNLQAFFYEKKTAVNRCDTKFPKKGQLVGGFNPFYKHMSSWIISLSRGQNKQYLKPPPIVESQPISREKLQTWRISSQTCHDSLLSNTDSIPYPLGN